MKEELSHSLRGVWVEIIGKVYKVTQVYVTPFGECGLKFLERIFYLFPQSVTPFGECGLKLGACGGLAPA